MIPDERVKGGNTSTGQINQGLRKLFFNGTQFLLWLWFREPLQLHPSSVRRVIQQERQRETHVYLFRSPLDALCEKSSVLLLNSHLINWRHNIYANKRSSGTVGLWLSDWWWWISLNLRVPLMGFAEGHNLCSFETQRPIKEERGSRVLDGNLIKWSRGLPRRGRGKEKE